MQEKMRWSLGKWNDKGGSKNLARINRTHSMNQRHMCFSFHFYYFNQFYAFSKDIEILTLWIFFPFSVSRYFVTLLLTLLICLATPGAIICKRAPFETVPMTVFRANWAIACSRCFEDAAWGKWSPKFPKSLILLAPNSTCLCLLEFCWSVFVVLSCSSRLKEVRQCRI